MITVARPRDSQSAHYYTPDGEPCYSVPCKSRPGETRAVTIKDCRKLGLVPSPTTIIRLLHRHSLVQWQIEQACLAVLTTPRNDGEELDAFVERVIQTDRVQDEERDSAARKGKEIHRALEDMLSGNRIVTNDDALSPYVLPVVVTLQMFGRVIFTEKTIVGDGYCGITDCGLENPEEIWVIDFKCTRTIPDKPYDEHRLQLAAYAAGLGNTGEQRVRCANMYISTREPGIHKMIEIENWQHDYIRFQTLLEFWRLTNLKGNDYV